MTRSPKTTLRLLAVAWPFVLIVILQTALATFSLQVTSSLRAFVTGESLWSKGQHDALYYLNRYAESGNRSFVDRYHQAIAIPMGDRAARLALEASPADNAAAFEGFLKGGNHPDDIPNVIWLFRYFRWLPIMDASIRDWRTAEGVLMQLLPIGEAIDASRHIGEADRREITRQLDEINALVTPLTRRFSDRLGEGTRQVQTVLFAVNLAIALLFIALTVWRLNSFLTHRRTIEDQLSHSANHDDLTGLPNRRLFEEKLAGVLDNAEARHALMFIDLDQFKAVNDNGGHAAGDELLRRVSRDLSNAIRGSDVLARLGGDEFGIVLPNCLPDDALRIAMRLREITEGIDFVWSGHRYSISASIGVVHLGGRGYTLQEALRAADIACYMAKEKGRNRVHVYETSDAAQSQFTANLSWVQRLHRALEEDRFQLFSQAIVAADGSGEEGEHCEILLRLEENGKLLSPGAFIPAAERYGLMPSLDRWVIRNALDLIGRNAGPASGTYSINLSGLTLKDDTFLPFFREALQRSRVSAGVLCFEITETSAIENLDEAIAFMNAMRAMGCRFALDDFGVGMSSLTYLKRLPVDYVKIDGSFVRDMLSDKTDWMTVEMINQISHLAGRRTIAEFVESPEILAALRTIGVDYVQGYAIARPVPFQPGPSVPEIEPRRASVG
ncbi:putative bifunctional diguanylate cyclase/phosphodiesterase [Shinella zoogloeoides]|uniref:EAL domain-containing protein n=1 Tax=Shinella zoogloeoides TaxID=352475 RepID=A0A6N8TCW9_SHIZO|nr:EAL domain-containing protein [Shinella zoogloeoides]MXO00451.1 EAL domain-containing protein [Shinella zoogloeoides]UEX83954.1 EAL domain-containing protein [Shinella zoogloeoides]